MSQIPDSILFDWDVSGEEILIKPERKKNFIDPGLVTDGKFDYTKSLQKLINSHNSDSQLVIHFPKGTYKFSGTIYLKSGITLEGEGSTKTIFIFDNGGTGNLFEISASQNNAFFWVNNGLWKHSKTIEVADESKIIAGNYYELIVDGDGLATSNWAMNSIGQIFKIESLKNKYASLSTELKLDYFNYSYPRVRLIKPITNVHFRFFSVERLDKSTGQTNNFNFNYAANCTVIGVESNKSNMSHVAFSKSYRCRVADSYVHHAFDYGGGGKAYGIELSNSSSNCHIENTIFENLRHSILLQSGANGNVISGNYSLNPFWNEGLFPANSAGELVLHGNYPFANLFEGNQVGNIVVDNSHGYNGPGNMFYRNRANTWGAFMNPDAGNATHFIGNEITGIFKVFTGTGNNINSNYYTDTDTSLFKSLRLPSSLYLKNKPLWWPAQKPYPAIGLPPTNQLSDIPAKYRFNHDSLRALNTSPEIFIVNFTNEFKEINGQVVVGLESKLQVNVESLRLEKMMEGVNFWFPASPDYSNGFLFQSHFTRDSFLVPTKTTCYRWKAQGFKNQTCESDTFCVQNEIVSLKKIKPTQLLIYPNPTDNSININLTKPSLVTVYSMVGEVLLSQNFELGMAIMDLKKLPMANYIIEVFDGISYYRQIIQKF